VVPIGYVTGIACFTLFTTSRPRVEMSYSRANMALQNPERKGGSKK
jgi:hypothetical protein